MFSIVNEIFKKDEIKSIEKLYEYVERKKIVVFVPLNIADKISLEMSRAGAGVIGNYKQCSFRINGTGTFKPNSKAKPTAGEKNKLNYEKEIRLEMEFGSADLNKVTDSLLKHHPYEEPAYEIYDFRKRGSILPGKIVTLKKKIDFSRFIVKLNKNIKFNESYFESEISRFVILNSDFYNNITKTAKFLDCQCVVISTKNKFKIITI